MQKMALRIACWVLAGAAVTCLWTLFAMLAVPPPGFGHWAVVAVTLPASLLSSLLWPAKPVGWQTVMFLNAAIYGLAGLALEPLFRLRRRSSTVHLPAR
jgi:hypothetical protein